MSRYTLPPTVHSPYFCTNDTGFCVDIKLGHFHGVHRVSATCLHCLKISLQAAPQGFTPLAGVTLLGHFSLQGARCTSPARRKGPTLCLTSIFPIFVCHMLPHASHGSLRNGFTNPVGKSMNPHRNPMKRKLMCCMSLSSLTDGHEPCEVVMKEKASTAIDFNTCQSTCRNAYSELALRV